MYFLEKIIIYVQFYSWLSKLGLFSFSFSTLAVYSSICARVV